MIILCICRFIPCEIHFAIICLHTSSHVFYYLIGSQNLAIDSPLHDWPHTSIPGGLSESIFKTCDVWSQVTYVLAIQILPTWLS